MTMQLHKSTSEIAFEGRSVLVRRPKGGGLVRIRWYGTLSQKELRKTARSAVEVEEEEIEIIDESSGEKIVDGTASLQDLTTILGVSIVKSRSSSVREIGIAAFRLLTGGATDTESLDLLERHRRVSSESQDQQFQGQILKFERVLSHLASERTVLAWLRAALTMIAQGLAIWQLKASATPHLKPYLWAVACIYFVFVPIIIAVSLRRWNEMKRILTLRETDVQLVLNAVNLSFQAFLLLGICLAAAFTFFFVGSDDSVFADFRPANFIDT